MCGMAICEGCVSLCVYEIAVYHCVCVRERERAVYQCVCV